MIVFRGHLPASSLEGMKGVYGLHVSDSSCRILVDDHHERLPQILDLLTGLQVTIHDLRIQESDLEDVFIAFAK